MKKETMAAILAEHLAHYRTWSYRRLAEEIDRTRREHGCLGTAEGTAPDGTKYFIEVNVFWDDQPGGDIRVIGALSAMPQRRLLGFLPICIPDATDTFIMNPDGGFVGEEETSD